MRRLTDGQQRAMRVLCALARTALDVCNLIAERGEESDDRPRMWLVSFERWTRGEETGPQLAARTRAMTCAMVIEGDDRESAVAERWKKARFWLIGARADFMVNPGHKHHAPRVLRDLARTVEALTGDTPDAAAQRVTLMFNAHTAQVASEWATAKRDAALTQTKADRAAAERALGTLRGVM